MDKVINDLVTPNVLPSSQLLERLHLYYLLYLFRSVDKAVLVVVV